MALLCRGHACHPHQAKACRTMNATMRMLGRYPEARHFFAENLRLREQGTKQATHGPAAQFLWTMRKCQGWTFNTETLTVHLPSGEDFMVDHHDSELLAHHTRDALRASRWREAAKRRPSLQGMEEIPVDRECSLAYLNSLRSASDRKLMQSILTGGLKTRERAHRAKQATNPGCPWVCWPRGVPETLHHVYYDCSAWAEHRPATLMQDLFSHPQRPPCTLMHGLALESETVQQASREISSQRIPEVSEDVRARLGQGDGQNQEGRTADGRTIIYTDGANKRGFRSQLRQGGIGAFWGAGHFANFALPLGGRSQTNQRAELQAFLRAAQTDPRRLLIKTDSQYVVGGVRQFPCWRERGWEGPNWDLWEQVRQLLSADPSRVDVQWVKGHASMADVRRNVTTWEDRVGNNCADRLAGQGADLACLACPSLAAATALQQQRREFAVAHHKMLLGVAKEWHAAVQELPFLYSRAAPNPCAPPSRPGSFARRALRRRLV